MYSQRLLYSLLLYVSCLCFLLDCMTTEDEDEVGRESFWTVLLDAGLTHKQLLVGIVALLDGKKKVVCVCVRVCVHVCLCVPSSLPIFPSSSIPLNLSLIIVPYLYIVPFSLHSCSSSFRPPPLHLSTLQCILYVTSILLLSSSCRTWKTI